MGSSTRHGREALSILILPKTPDLLLSARSGVFGNEKGYLTPKALPKLKQSSLPAVF